MHDEESTLSTEERTSITAGRWFSSLSSTLRHDMLRRLRVRRFTDREPISFRGQEPCDWMVCAKGAVEIGTTTARGRAYTLTYVWPGIWFGETAILGDTGRTHDAVARGMTSIACMSRADLRLTLSEHSELAHALLTLQARRVRWLVDALHEAQDLPLRARVAAQILKLSRSHGDPDDESGIRLALRLTQSDLARLVGSSRQRLNQELKDLERLGMIRQGAATLVVTDRHELRRVASAC